MPQYKSQLVRFAGNPLFRPEEFPYGIADQVFNPGQVMTPDGRTILLLSVLPRGERLARCHVAESSDGIHFTIHEKPLFSADDTAFPGLDNHPIDCRITWFPEDDCYYIIRPGGDTDTGTIAFLYRTKDFITAEPIEIVAMTHNPAFLEKDRLTYLLWSMIPETRAFCPRGLGIVPYRMPSSFELADATIAELAEYDVVMWEKHGVLAVGTDIMEAFDMVDTLSKSAQIYMTARAMGFEPEGTTLAQMEELRAAFHLPK